MDDTNTLFQFLAGALPRRFKPLWCNGCYGHHWTWRRLIRCG